ncbi:hypothetical protein CC80DRAFT_488455 [Byssothecium circinans]|uniref:Extracellular membrane protein CFEM domain-containing protein n=1 Tax=Byssothecium circinans TaxID=147558 RepID=A0A6A5U8R9_9PLEO|nr:hypothetical protein CC80DRAFT_488455 [Byssothecium circinans]
MELFATFVLGIAAYSTAIAAACANQGDLCNGREAFRCMCNGDMVVMFPLPMSSTPSVEPTADRPKEGSLQCVNGRCVAERPANPTWSMGMKNRWECGHFHTGGI